MRNWLIALVCLLLFGGTLALTIGHPETTSPTLYTYFVASDTTQTGAQNIVAAILLNYRMYDTVFEAMILLTAVMGMLHFLHAGRSIGSGRDDSTGSSGNASSNARDAGE